MLNLLRNRIGAGGHVKGLREGENEPYFTIDRSSARLALTMSRSFRMLSR